MRKWLKDMRAKEGLSQSDFAKRVGVTPGYCCEIESGSRQRDMTYSMMERLASALNVPVQEVVNAETAYRKGKTMQGSSI